MKHFKLLSIQAAPPSSPSPPPFSSSILNLIAHGVSFRGRLSPFEATKLCSCAGSAKNDTCEIWPEVARGGKFSRDRSRLYRGRFFAIWIFWHCPTLCPTSSPTSFCDLKQIRKNNICIYLLEALVSLRKRRPEGLKCFKMFCMRNFACVFPLLELPTGWRNQSQTSRRARHGHRLAPSSRSAAPSVPLATLDRVAEHGRRHDGRSRKFQEKVARFRLCRRRSLQANTRFATFPKMHQII